MGAFYAQPQFQQKFGTPVGNGQYELTAAWKSGLSNGAAVGQILGLFINGIVSERIGYRYTVMASLVWLTGFIAMFVMAHNLVMLQLAEILCGIPWGVFQTLCITYGPCNV